MDFFLITFTEIYNCLCLLMHAFDLDLPEWISFCMQCLLFLPIVTNLTKKTTSINFFNILFPVQTYLPLVGTFNININVFQPSLEFLTV